MQAFVTLNSYSQQIAYSGGFVPVFDTIFFLFRDDLVALDCLVLPLKPEDVYK